VIDATDAAIALADVQGIKVTDVPGSGKDGRVTKPDVEAYLEAKVD
jgi:pyruvate/2-oxoglutarate dehydrogenase complex dihydrolipoamide acyltransferase (E2) component